MRSRLVLVVLLFAAASSPAAMAHVTDPSSTIDGARGDAGDRRIDYVGSVQNRWDLAHLGFGRDGHWFAQFDESPPGVEARPTGENTRDALPSWVAAFNHTEHPGDPGCTELDALPRGCTPTYAFRTFSQDGPARSAGGFERWATIRLPDGDCGTAGAIVDPHTFVAEQEHPDPTGVVFPAEGEPAANTNNTINRIQLQDGVPDSFFIGVVTDTTAGAYDPGDLEIRGNVGLVDQRQEVADSQVEPATSPAARDLHANGVPDIHVFRVDHFRSGDYLKLRLKGGTSAASFSGLLFDESFDPLPSGPPEAAHPTAAESCGHARARG